jgi:hypothetical protein
MAHTATAARQAFKHSMLEPMLHQEMMSLYAFIKKNSNISDVYEAKLLDNDYIMILSLYNSGFMETNQSLFFHFFLTTHLS